MNNVGSKTCGIVIISCKKRLQLSIKQLLSFQHYHFSLYPLLSQENSSGDSSSREINTNKLNPFEHCFIIITDEHKQ